MATQYRCNNKRRLKEVTTRTTLHGIDYLEVAPDQKNLKVHLIERLSYPALAKENVVILGGVRIKASTITASPDGEGVVLGGELKVTGVTQSDEVLTVTVNEPGDFSTYTLRLVQSSANLRPPAQFDSQLAEVEFSFKVDCPSDFDCAPEETCPPELLEEPEINYLAKDYNSFRRLMLDRLSAILPAWQERNPADELVMLVELLAYAGDHLSYYQDAVANEAYLGTAHRRASVRRHARLLDYSMQDGSNARAWICVNLKPGSAPLTITEADLFLTRGEQDVPTLDPEDLEGVLRAETPEVFMPLHSQVLDTSRNEIHFHTWSDVQCNLPRGATRATLVRNPGLDLAPGDVLVFEEIISPTTGRKEDVDPLHRHVVRLVQVEVTQDPVTNPATPLLEVTWNSEDALPFPLCLSSLGAQDQDLLEVSVARGNVFLADHGRPVTGLQDRTLAPVPDAGRYRPRLPLGPLTQQGRVFEPDSKSLVLFNPKDSARSALRWDAREVLPCITLDLNGKPWTPVRDLLNSDRFAAEFVVETEEDGSAYLRFGDDILGLKPSTDPEPLATYRVGNGAAGNVGAAAISRLVLVSDPLSAGRVERVWNPLPGAGGSEPELLEQVRQFAPQAFRVQERAVTPADWAEVTQRQPGIQKAAARMRWTGSWYTAFVTIDRIGGLDVDAPFETALVAVLDRYRLAGYDLEINPPRYVPLQIELSVCVKPGYFRGNIHQSLLKAFSSATGFFHPDRFTFGQPLYLSQVYQTAMQVEGVESVDVKVFQRWGKAAAGELKAGKIVPGPFEVLRLDNDPNFPENGKIDFDMLSGL